MALNLNGTTGISGVDGSASAPALQGTDSNTGITFASDTVNINTGGIARAKVASNGKVSILTNGLNLEMLPLQTQDIFQLPMPLGLLVGLLVTVLSHLHINL